MDIAQTADPAVSVSTNGKGQTTCTHAIIETDKCVIDEYRVAIWSRNGSSSSGSSSGSNELSKIVA